jgi:phospholipid transport system substrate-binding protein
MGLISILHPGARRGVVARLGAWSRRVLAGLVALTVMQTLLPVAARATSDPAVQFMERVAKEMIAAQRSRSVQAMQVTVGRHGDMQAIGLYALGDYRSRLEAADREPYISGMTRFIGRYAATESPKHPVARVVFAPESRKAKYGITVDSTITMQDGTVHEVAWLLMKYGNSYRVRDAQALTFWMSPFLKKLFEDYIGQNNGSVKALITVLQRH